MKFSKFFLCLNLVSMCSAAFAYDKVSCRWDARPMDGSLLEVSFTKRSDNDPSSSYQYYTVQRRVVYSSRLGYVDDQTRSFPAISCISVEESSTIKCHNSSAFATLETKEENGRLKHVFSMGVNLHRENSVLEDQEFQQGACTFE